MFKIFKRKKDNKSSSRNVNSPSNENEIKKKQNKSIKGKQVIKEEVEKEIILPEPNLENENQPVQEKQKNKKIVEEEKNENDISSSIASSSSPSANILTPTPPGITLTPPNTTTTENDDDIQITSSNERQVAEININHFSAMRIDKVAGKATLQIFATSLAAAKPFFPWIETVTTLINEIVNRYDTVTYNKKTSLVLIERVEMIGLSVKALTRRREENFEKFQDSSYFHSFIRLHNVLKQVKEFIDDISELKGYRKFILASEVKDKANHLLSKLDTCCNDLQFSIIIANEIKEREQRSLDVDVAFMTKFLKSIEKTVNAEGEKTNKAIKKLYEEVSVIYQLVSAESDGKKETLFNVPKINPIDLHEAPKSTTHKYVNKRLLRNTISVACVKNQLSKRVQTHLSILKNVQSSNKIIKFHGESKIGDDPVLVFDWADHGNLKKLYEQNENFSWVEKLDIAHDIASGLVFLQAYNILHHDIRCENILITGDVRYEAKIANFQESRDYNDKSNRIETCNEIIRWLAPEKIPQIKDQKDQKDQKNLSKEPETNETSHQTQTYITKVPYTFKCEIFSFAMLLWELGAQKIPYEKMEMNGITTHVMAKKRESFKEFNKGLGPANNESIIKGFTRIIESAWIHESSQRPNINNIYQELDSLVGVHSPRIRPKYLPSDASDENSNNNNDEATTSEREDDHFEALEPILPLEDGIKAHREGNRDVAWKCFEIHATLGDPKAIHWQAYYYLRGYHVKANMSEAIKYFRLAADANIPESQYHYANAIKKAKRPGFLEYYIKAAENGYSLAQRELGLIYYYGNGVEADKEKGIQYLKLAALKDSKSLAIEDLKKIDPNLLNHEVSDTEIKV